MFFNCNMRSIFLIFNVSFVLIGRIFVFSSFSVVPVALFKVSKNLSTFAAGSWYFRNRLFSSAYWVILICLVLLGIWIPVIDLFILIFEVAASPCMTYKGRENRHLVLNVWKELAGEKESHGLWLWNFCFCIVF